MTQRYDSYKESGVQWIGEIPAHWKMLLNGILFVEDVRKPKAEDIPLSLSQVDGVIPTDEMKESSLKTSSYDNWKRVIVNDLVLNRFKAHLGVMFASNYIGMVSFHYGVFKAKRELIPKYYEYLYHTNVYRFIYADASKGMTVGLQNLSNSSFYNVKAIYPPLEEQKEIVFYLDDKCGKIDKLVEGKQKQIELLAEMKQRIIADAVTRGLNPNVKMKATNIPWLKEIPEHWEMKRLKYLVSCNDESLTNAEDPNLEINYVEIGDVTDIQGIAHTTKYRFEDAPSRARRKTRKNDVIVSTVRTYLKAIAKIPENGIIVSTGFAVLRAIDVNSSYLAFCCMSNSFINSVVALSKGISYPAITASELLNLHIPLPPFTEQRAIVTYLDDKCGKIDLLVEKLKAEIDAIKEYKQRLISDVVTGQIKVC